MSHTPNSSHDDTQPIYQWLLWIGIVIIAMIQIFLSFRGLDSPMGMDQAQIARELARGNGFSTKFIRPMAAQQLLGSGKELNLSHVPDVSQAPLQPLLWAPLFKLAEKKWPYETRDGRRQVYYMDRIIACLGVLWLLGTLLLTHGIARRLFDRTIAVFTVITLALCHPLWEMAASGSPRMLLLFLTTFFLHRLVEASRREQSGESLGFGLILIFALVSAMITLTHWMGIWVSLGLIAALWTGLPSTRAVAIATGIVTMLAVGGWVGYNYMSVGDPIGMGKAYLLGIITAESPATHMRDFSATLPGVSYTTVIHHVNEAFKDILSRQYTLLLGSIPAVLAVMSLMHRFRNPLVLAFRNGTFLTWVGILIGSLLFGGQGDEVPDNQLHVVLVPVLTMLGLAVMAVLWARLRGDRPTLWSDFGYAVVVIFISGWPMLSGIYNGLVVGLFYKDGLVHWPPYMPDRTALLGKMVEPNEVIVSDQPWAVAWYADRACLWLPKDKEQYHAFAKLAKEQGHPVAGLVLSPMSSMEDRLHSQMTGQYAPWADMIFRTPVLGFGIDLSEALPDSLGMKHAFPLAGGILGDGRVVPLMIFYSETDRHKAIK